MSSLKKEYKIISCIAEKETLQENIHLSGTNAGMCPELTLFLGKIKKAFPMQEKLCDEHFYKPNRVYEQSKTSFYHKKSFYPNLKAF